MGGKGYHILVLRYVELSWYGACACACVRCLCRGMCENGEYEMRKTVWMLALAVSAAVCGSEKIVMVAENFVRSNMGEQWMQMVPFISAIFALSLGSSLASLLGFWAPTADVSVLLGWALIVFILITYYKIKTNGFFGYLKGFCEPVFVMAPFNLLGEVFKPISMSFRHFGNVLSGMVISSLVYAALILANHALFGWLPGFLGTLLGNIPFLAVGIPAVLSLYFDWFSSAMQAFIFCMLTMIFIRTAAE